MNEVIDLSGKWELHPVSEFSNLWLSADAPKEGWIEQELPAHWQQNPDFSEYSGKMIYRKAFSFSPEKNRIYRLRLNGVFYRYRAHLNNFILGGACGYFFPVDFNLTRYLREENLLLLEVDSPHRDEERELLTGAFSDLPSLPQSYNPGGIWRPVEILSSGPAYIDDWGLRTLNLTDNNGEMLLETKIFSAEEEEAHLRVALAPDNFQGDAFELKIPLLLGKGLNSFQEGFKVNNIRPWWSWDLGDPNLYRINLTLEKDGVVWDQQSDRIGIRTFEFKEFLPYLNGERFLIKGSNYPPSQLYPAHLRKEEIEQDLALVKKSNQNMIRCYRHIEPNHFYQATDEAGVLVWQDFPHNPGSSLAAATLIEISSQLPKMVRLLKNRSSVVVWTVSNFSAAEDSSARRSQISGLEKLGRKLVEIDPTRPVATVSGNRSLFSPHDTGFGCGVLPDEGRLYSFARYLKGLRRRQIKFVSFFGAPTPSKDDSPTPADYGNMLPQNLTVSRKKRKGKADFWNSQGGVLRFYIDRLRYQKYRPTGGMLFFCFREFQPGFPWAVVDYNGRPKEGFEKVSLCYRPVYVFALFDKGLYRQGELLRFPICFSNDRRGPDPYATQVKVRLSDPDGQLVWKNQWQVNTGSDEETKVLGEVSVLLMKEGVYTLEILWRDGESIENSYRIPVK